MAAAGLLNKRDRGFPNRLLTNRSSQFAST
jgi:hypothetical protein